VKALNISDYNVAVPFEGVEKDVPYAVRPSLIGLLFSQRDLGVMEILSRDDIARKIRDWVGDQLLLEDAEFALLDAAVKAFKGYGKNDVELVRRVLGAEIVQPVATR